MARKRSSSATTEAAAEVLASQPTEAQAPPALPVRHDLVDPTVPAGMVRISDGSRERFIWPVHLSGWQQQGWTLVAAASGVQIAVTLPAPEPVIDAPAAAPTPEPSSSEPTAEGTEAETTASWELETSTLAMSCCSTTRCCEWWQALCAPLCLPVRAALLAARS